LANHNGDTIDDSIAFMNNRAACLSAATNRQFSQFRQRLLSWSGHAASWLEQRDIPVHVLRYEDLQANTVEALARALAFAGMNAPEEEVRRAVANANFAELRRQERAKGFAELPTPVRGGVFFRRGIAGAWRDELASEQVARIENEHAAMMRLMGYQLASATVSADS
jgi:hypothetical protein